VLNFRLGLKDQQEREIVHVMLYCCLQEKTYNPFYAFLANKFCEYERRFQVKKNPFLLWFSVIIVVRKTVIKYLRMGGCLLRSLILRKNSAGVAMHSVRCTHGQI